MKKSYFVSVLAAVLLGGTFLFSQGDEFDLDRVTRQVEALRKKVSSLAAQLGTLRKEFAHLRNQRGRSYPPGIPPGTPEREINGVKYYLVPVSEDPER